MPGGLDGVECPAAADRLVELGRDLADRDHLLGIGAEVPGAGEAAGVLDQALGQEEVAAERIQHMLPGADPARLPQHGRPAGLPGPDQIGHQTVGRHVAAADHVTRARRGDADAGLRQVGPPVGRGHDLRTGLAGAVGLEPAQGRVLVARLGGIPVALVAGDHDHATHGRRVPHHLQKVGRAHDVGREGGQGVPDAFQEQGLAGKVEDDLRCCRLGDPVDQLAVADVHLVGLHPG